MSSKPIPSRKVVGCCGQMFNNHRYEHLPFEVKSAAPNFEKYPDLKLKTALVGCHYCGWFNIRRSALVRVCTKGKSSWQELCCPNCGHRVQFANLTREQSLLLAP